jgi:hypothetical protein
VLTPSSGGLPVETELLLLLARAHLAPQAERRVRTLLAGDVDWIHLLRTAQGHGVLPLLYVQLRTIGAELVPDQILAPLGANFAQHVERNERLGAELVRLLSLLNAQSIAAVSVKGPALALAAYGDLSLREFIDLDVLIHRSDALRAREVFVRAGYTLMYANKLDERGFPQDPETFEYTFLLEDRSISAELHWRLTPLHLRGSLDLESMYSRRRSVTINGTAVPTPAPEEILLVLGVHGDHHQWSRLKWVCDVAELLRANPGLDWERVQMEARRLGCWRMVALGLRLAADCLDAPVPDRVATLVGQDRRVSVIAARLRGQLLDEGQDHQTRSRPYHPLQLLERSSDWVWNAAVVVRRLWTVTPNDKELLPLPAPLRMGYYPLRWGRVAWKYGMSPLLKRLGAGRLPPRG